MASFFYLQVAASYGLYNRLLLLAFSPRALVGSTFVHPGETLNFYPKRIKSRTTETQPRYRVKIHVLKLIIKMKNACFEQLAGGRITQSGCPRVSPGRRQLEVRRRRGLGGVAATRDARCPGSRLALPSPSAETLWRPGRGWSRGGAQPVPPERAPSWTRGEAQKGGRPRGGTRRGPFRGRQPSGRPHGPSGRGTAEGRDPPVRGHLHNVNSFDLKMKRRAPLCSDLIVWVQKGQHAGRPDKNTVTLQE